MPLTYVGKFKFENPAIMEDKECKQTKQFLVMGQKQAISFCL